MGTERFEEKYAPTQPVCLSRNYKEFMIGESFPRPIKRHANNKNRSIARAVRLLGIKNTGSISDSWRKKIKPLFSIGGGPALTRSSEMSATFWFR
jgi:hypothetical protein